MGIKTPLNKTHERIQMGIQIDESKSKSSEIIVKPQFALKKNSIEVLHS